MGKHRFPMLYHDVRTMLAVSPALTQWYRRVVSTQIPFIPDDAIMYGTRNLEDHEIERLSNACDEHRDAIRNWIIWEAFSLRPQQQTAPVPDATTAWTPPKQPRMWCAFDFRDKNRLCDIEAIMESHENASAGARLRAFWLI